MVAATLFLLVGGYTCAQWVSLRGSTDRIVPELSNERALGRLADWQALPVLDSGRYRLQSSEDRHTGEEAPIDLWRRGNRDMNNFVCASADADPPPAETPFVLDRAPCPEPHVQGYVLSRFAGTGRLARLWMTAASFRREPPDREVFRIYVDDRPEPVVEAALSRVLDGTASEMFAPPFGAGSHRRMAWYYPLVFAKRLIVTIDHLDPRDLYFHQTAVVLEDERHDQRASSGRLALRDEVRRSLRTAAPPAGSTFPRAVRLNPGEPIVTHELTGPATIVEARLRCPGAQLAALREVGLQVQWDGAAGPAIEVPLGSLFGVFEAPPSYRSVALGTRRDGKTVSLQLRLPMPFASRARWTLDNHGEQPIDLDLALQTVASLPSRPWGHLTAQRFVTTEPVHAAHPLVRARGPGRLAGVCLAMRGHGMRGRGRKGHPFNFLEGDELGTVDGVRAIPGTGTEDYFNGAFYFEDGPGATAFAQVWDIQRKIAGAPGQARASACRWHVLGDTIDFSDTLELDMEVGPGDPAVLDRFESVAYLYLAAGGSLGTP